MAILALVAVPVLAQAGDSRSVVGEGMASYYSSEFAGSRTANGERFDPDGMTAAHRSLAFHSRVAVTNLANGKSAIVAIHDRGPYVADRIVDLSPKTAADIGIKHQGVARVEVAPISVPLPNGRLLIGDAGREAGVAVAVR